MIIFIGIVAVVLFYFLVLTPLIWFLTEGLETMGWIGSLATFFMLAAVINMIVRHWDELHLLLPGSR